jgi:hypothetical protein
MSSLVVIVVVLVAVVAAAATARWAAGKARSRLDARLAALDVVRRDKANFYGLASAGGAQVRGLGVLALTPDELVFAQLVPDREIRVPRAGISGVRTERSFLGKTQGRDLLVVTWSDDEAAWDVPDVAAWSDILRGHREGADPLR